MIPLGRFSDFSERKVKLFPQIFNSDFHWYLQIANKSKRYELSQKKKRRTRNMKISLLRGYLNDNKNRQTFLLPESNNMFATLFQVMW